MSVNKLLHNLKSILSIRQKACINFVINCIKSPLEIKSHVNFFCYEWEVLEKDQINFTPPIFAATIIDQCNLRCPTCLWLLQDPNKFFNNYLSVDNFRTILEKYNAKTTGKVVFLGGGEPLLHPQFAELVDISRDYGLIPKISTNGILIEKHILALKKLDYVNVSLDAYNYESFKINRGGSPEQFDKIITGLNLLKENGINFSMSFLLSTKNLAETNSMMEFAEQIGPNFVYFHNINPHGNHSINPLTINDKDTQVFLKKFINKTDFKFDITIGAIFDTESEAFNKGRCIQPWFYFCFNSVGDVGYCCHLEHNKKIGNVFEDYDLNSAAMKTFRKNMIEGKFPASCQYCQRRFMGKEYAVFTAQDKKWSVLSA